LLKIANEAVVEGMCKTIGRQADSTRGLITFGRSALRFFMLLLFIVRTNVVAFDVVACDDVAYVAFSSRDANVSNFHFFMQMMLLFYSYANEAKIVWNAPLTHQADPFLTECLDIHFREAMKWHFWSIDKKNRALVSLISNAIDKLMKRETKLEFMTYKKERSPLS
jgi:hypothetical protein